MSPTAMWNIACQPSGVTFRAVLSCLELQKVIATSSLSMFALRPEAVMTCSPDQMSASFFGSSFKVDNDRLVSGPVVHCACRHVSEDHPISFLHSVTFVNMTENMRLQLLQEWQTSPDG